MAWQVVVIENPARLSLRDNRLVIAQEQEVCVPIEDLDALVLDSYGIITTANLLVALATGKTTVVFCDEKHLPASVLLPYSQHSRQAKISRQQLAMSQPLKKQLWREIIVNKITNQADVLKHIGLDDSQLRELSEQVRSGDVSNRESVAARLYFDELLDDATRRKPIWHNAALNYGYAIVRSHIARHVAARGLVSSQGIFHHSELNGFNLVDDLIESYRPIVDLVVMQELSPLHQDFYDSVLTEEDRRVLVDILNKSVIIYTKKFPLRLAVEKTVGSFIDCIISNSSDKLLLPKIILD